MKDVCTGVEQGGFRFLATRGRKSEKLNRKGVAKFWKTSPRKFQNSLHRTNLQLSFSSVAAGYRHFIASRTKIFVPRLREFRNQVLRGLPRDRYAGMHDISPGMYARTSCYSFFEADPLRQDHAQGVVDPAHLMRGLAVGDHVADHRFYRLQHFNLQAASRSPRASFAPVQFAVDIRELIPAAPIGEDLPRARAAGPGGHGILKSKHESSSSVPVLGVCWGTSEGVDLGSIIYTLLV
jgi:hypothetical protein